MNFKQTQLLIASMLFAGHAWAEERVLPLPRGYTAQVTGSPKVSDTIAEVSWKFNVATRTDKNGTDVPEASIFVVVNDKVIRVGRYTGYPKTVANFKKAGMPSDSILACKTWFGGAGDDLYVAKEDDTTLAVYHRHVDEADDVLPPFRKIKKIKVPAQGP